MLLSNFKKLIYSQLGQYFVSVCNIKNTEGELLTSINYGILKFNTASKQQYGGNYSNTTTAYNFTHVSLVFGGGTTAPTVDDYHMEIPYDINNHYNFDSCSSYCSDAETSYVTVTGTITNKSDSNLSVSEIGLVAMSGDTSNACNVLIARDVIDPIVLSAGESKAFVYKVNFNEMVG